MDKNLFQKFIEYLVDEDNESALKILSLFEEIDDFFDKFHTYIIENKLSKKHIAFYNEIKSKELPHILHNRISKPYCELEKLYIDACIYLFGLSPFETEIAFDKYLSDAIKSIKNKNIEKLLQGSYSFNLILENQKVECNDPSNFLKTQLISSYSLGILYLIIAEKSESPIFGLPLEDKLVLVLADEHCTHNEMVYEDNIKYYISLSEKNIIYRPKDLYLLALLEEKEVHIDLISPKSNSTIIRNWMENILSYNSPKKTQDDLSIKYQQLGIGETIFH